MSIGDKKSGRSKPLDDPTRTADLPAFEGKLRALISTSVPAVSSARLHALFIHRAGITPVTAIGKRTVGRGGLADIRIREPSLSRLHARIEEYDGKLWVEDLGARHGMLMDGKPVTQVALVPGQHVHLGNVILAVVRNLGPNALARTWSHFIDHERFMVLLKDDVFRGRAFNRGVGLLMLRDETSSGAILLQADRILKLLGPADRVALYSAGVLEIARPEATVGELRKLAYALSALCDPPLICGAALFPEAATAFEALLGQALRQLQRGTIDKPVHGVGDEEATTTRELRELRPSASGDSFVVVSSAMLDLYEQVAQLGKVEMPALICGETGTGKEVVARAVHDQSSRSGRPMRYINCAAIAESLLESALFGHERGAFTGAHRRTEGVFEAAHGSTLLLDEVSELSLASQAALLRVLETGTLTRVGGTQALDVDVRVLAATNQDLQQLCNEKLFRVDLLFRLNAMTLVVPPLRERIDEIEPLALHFVRQTATKLKRPALGIEPAAVELLERYPWPGNVRELRNVIDRAIALARTSKIMVGDLPSHVQSFAEPRRRATDPVRTDQELIQQTDGLDFKRRLQRIETALILDALKAENWHQAAAAKRLGIPIRTMTYKMKAFGIRRAGFQVDSE